MPCATLTTPAATGETTVDIGSCASSRTVPSSAAVAMDMPAAMSAADNAAKRGSSAGSMDRAALASGPTTPLPAAGSTPRPPEIPAAISARRAALWASISRSMWHEYRMTSSMFFSRQGTVHCSKGNRPHKACSALTAARTSALCSGVSTLRDASSWPPLAPATTLAPLMKAFTTAFKTLSLVGTPCRSNHAVQNRAARRGKSTVQ